MKIPSRALVRTASTAVALVTCVASRAAAQPSWAALPPEGLFAFSRVDALLLCLAFVAVVAFALFAWGVTLRRRLIARTREADSVYREFSTLLTGLPCMVYRLRYPKNGIKRFLFADGAALRVHGIARDDFLSLTEDAFIDMIHPDDRELAFSGMADQLWRTGWAQAQFRTRGRWVRAWERVVENLGDSLIVAGVLIDVHDDVEAKAAAELKSRQLAAVLDNLPDIAWVKDTEGRFIAANHALADACGVADPRMLVGKTDLDFFPPEQAEAYRADDREIIRSGVAKQVEEPQTRADGRQIWIHTIKAPVVDARGGVIGTVGSARDITARKEMEVALRDTAARLEALVSNLPGVAYIKHHDADGSRVLFVSEGAREMFNASPEALYGMSAQARLIEIWHPEDHETVRDLNRRMREGGARWEGRVRMRRSDGGWRWVMIRERATGRDEGGIRTGGLIIDIDEQVRAEERLELLSAAMDGVNEIAVLVGESGRFEYVNDEACRINGYTREELLTLHVADIVVDLPREAWPDHWRYVTEKGGVRLDVTQRRKDGSLYPAEVVVTRIVHQGREMNLAFARDITARKAMEESLRDRESEFRALIENSPDLVGRYAPDGRRLYMNPTLARITGEDDPRLIGKMPSETGLAGEPDNTFLSFFRLSEDGNAIDDPSMNGPVPVRYEKGIRMVADSGREEAFELIWKDGEGNLRATHLRFVPEMDSAGKIVSVLAVGRDISARKAMEEKLRETSQHLETVIANFPGTIFRIRYDAANRKKFIFADGQLPRAQRERYERTTPLDHEQMVEEFPPECRKTLFEDFPRLLRTEGRVDATVRIPFDPEAPTWLYIVERVVAFEGEDMITEGVSMDVTREVEAKEALVREETELRRLNDLLAEERRQAALGGLAGGIAHDFNNLLGAINGFAGFIVEDSGPDAPAGRHAARILGAARRGRELVDQVMILTGRKRLSISRHRLADLLADADAGHDEAVATRCVVVWDGISPQTEIDADRDLLRLALRNLCRNALSASPNGEVRVVIHPARVEGEAARRFAARTGANAAWAVEAWEDDDGTWAVTGLSPAGAEAVSIAVIDHGAGMDIDLLRNVFTPFFSTRDRARNPGLGLPVVQGVTIRHGGALTVHCAQGRGTTVEMLLPCEGDGE